MNSKQGKLQVGLYPAGLNKPGGIFKALHVHGPITRRRGGGGLILAAVYGMSA